MSKRFAAAALVIIGLILLAGLTLPACNGAVPAQQPSSTEPASTQGNTSGTGNTADTSASHIQSGPPGGKNMSKVLTRAAAILGVSSDTFISAFEQAQKSVFGERPSGDSYQTPQHPSGSAGQSGQPPQHPSGSAGQSEPPPQPPSVSGQQGQPPSGGGFQGQSDMMQKVYSKMADILNVSVDKISTAMEQAFKEVSTSAATTQ